jgi:2-phosphosulfolactate phosphatase
MNVEVFLTSSGVTEESVEGRTVIVIDVLRASSTIVAALNNWAKAVVPVPDMAQAGKIASNLDPSTYLLGGERGGDKIEGYHLGNSPLEYTQEAIEGRTVILNTTNGTGAISASRSARHLIVGCLLNAERVVEFTRNAGLDVAIVCAGWRGRIALEDTLCAGLLMYRLWDGREPGRVSDAAHIAFTQYLHDKDRLVETLRKCNHAQYLTSKGYGEDVDFCLQLDTLPVLPYYEDNRLILYKEPEYEILSEKAVVSH